MGDVTSPGGRLAMLKHAPQPWAIGFLEPHLQTVGGIRRVLETANRLVLRGHDVTIYLPDDQPHRCDWMPCLPRLKSVGDGASDELDFLIFNEEPQWYLLERFRRARRRVFLALSYGQAYDKRGSWESLRCGVDHYLANSRWTAECITREIGRRPLIVPTGVDTAQFRPIAVRKTYPVLCTGDARPWKGTGDIDEACRILGLPLQKLTSRRRRQSKLAREYSKAEVFVVGSRVEGFGFPGLEALACGVPLVTTDNGGSREYAENEVTALVVPPGDPHALARAIQRIRSEPSLRAELVRNGLERARTRFSWDRAALGLEEALGATANRRGASLAPRGEKLRPREPDPVLSVISLAWNHLSLTQKFVQSVRQHTDVPYELILVDNGSTPDSRSYVAQAADEPILNTENLGFAKGCNQGLERARGEYVAFMNNDTRVPAGWASRLVRTLERDAAAGIVFPAVTAASNRVTVREGRSDNVGVLDPFLEPPSGVALLMRTSVARALGGFDERFPVASGEDTDLCFKVWVNDLSALLDEAVLIDHVGKASSGSLTDRRRRWAFNRALFLDKWTGPLDDLPRMPNCPPDRFEANKAFARGVAFWMRRYFELRDAAAPFDAAASSPRPARRLAGVLAAPLRLGWTVVRPLVPSALRIRLYRRLRTRYEAVFPERRPGP